MESHSFTRTGPKAFILAADGQFSSLKPGNDQVWALSLAGSDAYPYHLHTTYNLRARSMRVFPNFISGNQRLSINNDFTLLPTVTRYSPAYIRINCQLINNADILFDCMVTEPDVLVGSIKARNLGDHQIRLTIEVSAILVPMGKGIPTRPEKTGFNQFIAGQADNLFPVLFMSGGPTACSNPYPTLSLPIEIDSHQSQIISWTLVTKNNRESSLDTAKKVIASNWRRTATVHLMKHTCTSLHIQTGNPDWDAAFTLAQSNAITHLAKCSRHDDTPFFIRNRLPNQSTLNELNKNDYDDLTTLEATHLAQVILPAHADLLVGVVKKFVDRINQQGCLSSQLDGSAYRQAFDECPLLASLSLELFETNQDESFLQHVYPLLCRLTSAWLPLQQDPQDGSFPTWESPQQLQLDTGLFTFDIWGSTGCGLDIQSVESPALAAMLHRETMSLRKIAQILADMPGQKQYSNMEKSLQKKILEFWQDNLARFAYLDRQSHQCPPPELFSSGAVQETIEINKKFSFSQRLQLHLFSENERSRVCTVRFKGQNPQGEMIEEEISYTNIRWVLGRAHLTTQNLFGSLIKVNLTGLQTDDRYLLETANLSQCDITCLLPIWSGGMQQEHLKTILNSHLDGQNPTLKYGIPEIWKDKVDYPESLRPQVNVLWNTLIIQGLVRQGQVKEAMVLFTNLMSAIVKGLKDYDGFYPFFNSESCQPAGQPNVIASLAPVRLFLQIAGIRLFSPTRLAVWGANPFPWPIEVHWQGLSLRRDDVHTEVMFPDGTSYNSDTTKHLLLTAGVEGTRS